METMKRKCVGHVVFGNATAWLIANKPAFETLDKHALRSKLVDKFNVPFAGKTVETIRKCAGFPELPAARRPRGSKRASVNRLRDVVYLLDSLFIDLGVDPNHPTLVTLKRLANSKLQDDQPDNDTEAAD